jgi:hypothetical protein
VGRVKHTDSRGAPGTATQDTSPGDDEGLGAIEWEERAWRPLVEGLAKAKATNMHNCSCEASMPAITGDKTAAERRFWHPVHGLVMCYFRRQQAS